MYKDFEELKKLAEQAAPLKEELKKLAEQIDSLNDLPNGFQSFAKYEIPIRKDYKLQELREQTKIQENTLDEQKRQSDIMEIWGKMMEKQTELMTRQIEIQEKQSQENDKVAKNNKFLGWIVGIATIVQAFIACLDYKEAIRVNPPSAIEQIQQPKALHNTLNLTGTI